MVSRNVLCWITLAGLALSVALPVAGAEPPDGWQIRFTASQSGVVDRGRLVLGASTVSESGFDTYDEPEPPAWPAHGLDVFTEHSDQDFGWEGQPLPLLRYRRDFGAPVGPVDRTLEFVVEASQVGDVTLAWSLGTDIDLAQHSLTLTDLDSGASVDMWEVGVYAFPSSLGRRHFRIQLVAGRPAPPIAHDQSLATSEDTSLGVTLTATDPEGDPLTFSLVSPAAHGTVLGLPPQVTYVPDPDFNGADAFTFRANDGQADSNLATISINVTSVNDAPVALPQSVSADEDTPSPILLTGSDVDGDALAFTLVSLPAHGALTGIPPALTYTPAPNYTGPDAFSFLVDDGAIGSPSATVSIAVNAVNDPPVADFTVAGPEHSLALWDNNLGALAEGAGVAGFSSQTSPSGLASALLDDDPNTVWRSAPTHITEQFVIVQLAGNAGRRFDRVRLINMTSTDAIKRFAIAVSTTTADPGAFTTLLEDLALNNTRVQEFPLPQPTVARYVRLLVHDNYGNTSTLALRTFEVVDSRLAGVPAYHTVPANVAAASEGGSAAASSESVSFPARQSIDGNPGTRWASTTGPATRPSLTVTLARGQIYRIDRVRLFGLNTADSVRGFEVAVSATTAEASAFSLVLASSAAQQAAVQEFLLPDAIDARYVRLTVTSNNGGANSVSLGELEVISTARPVPSVSGYQDFNSRPEQLLDGRGNTSWLTATGRIADEYVVLQLEEPSSIDRLRLQTYVGASTDVVKDFEVWVSVDGVAFSQVLVATLQNSAALQEFVFPGGAVRASQLKLVVKSNYGYPSYARLSTIEVPAAVSDGHIVSIAGNATNPLRSESPSWTENGAVVVRYSSAADASRTPAAMLTLKFGSPWATTSLAGQYAVVQLAGARSHSLEGVKLTPVAGTDCVRDFELWVSNTDAADASFALVLQATLLRNAQPQTFLFLAGAAPARFVKYVPLTNYGHASSLSTEELEMLATGAGGVHSFSSQLAPNYRPENAVDGDNSSIWYTASGAVTNQWVKFLLAGSLTRRLSGVSIHPYSVYGPRQFDVLVSTTTADDTAFSIAYSGTLTSTDVAQRFDFPAPIDAKYVKFYWRTGFQTAYIATRELAVLTEPEAHTAVLLGSSSELGTFYSAGNTLSIDPTLGHWQTAAQQTANQWIKLALPEAQSWRIDQLLLEPAGNFGDANSVRDFELQVSTTTSDDAAFQTVLSGTLRNDATLQHFRFAPTLARYVRFLARNNYGGTYLTLQRLWVLSPERGGTTVRFLDRSSDPDGAPAQFEWSFGDGTTSTERDPLHVFSAPGVYPVRLLVTDAAGGSAERTLQYHALNGPEADFAFAPPLPNEGQAVSFNDLSAHAFGLANFREWDFGDGTARVYNQQAPSHIFTDNGAYPVRLRVAGESGLIGTVTKVVTVANVTPVANAGPDLTILWGKPWNVGASATDPGSVDLQTLACRWSFGDGTPDAAGPCNTTVRVAHQFARPGIYTATLTVTDKDGASASDSVVVTVNKRRTGLSVCGPRLGIADVSAPIEITAALLDLDDATRTLESYPVLVNLSGQDYPLATERYAVAHLRLTLGSGAALPVQGTYAGDDYYLPSQSTSTAEVRTLAQPMRADSEGTEHWLGFQTNYESTPELTLFVTGSTTTTGRVAVPALGFCASVSVTAGQVTSVALPSAAEVETADGVEPKAVHLTFLDEVTVYGLNRVPFTTDAFLGYPADVLGTEHLVQDYATTSSWGAQLAVVASADETVVSITPTSSLVGRPAGVPFSVALNRGEIFQLRQPNLTLDLAGTAVSSDKPVALFSGNRCTFIPQSAAACNHVVEQMPPLPTWGRRFFTVPLATRLNGDTFRFLASENGTQVTLNGAVVVTLNRGQSHERIVQGLAEITANHPILVVQYSNGNTYDGVSSDPFMLVIPPYEQQLAAYTVTTPATGFPVNFVNVVVRAEGAGSIRVDGTLVASSTFAPIGTTGYHGGSVPITPGSHHLTGGLPFAATIYGFFNFDGYGYLGGMSLAPIAEAAQISLVPASETSPVGQQRCVTATVTDAASTPVIGVRVDFLATGANAGTGFAPTDEQGQAGFCYVGTHAGSDSIMAAVGALAASATKTWIGNGAPVAADQSVTTLEETPVAITLTATDGDGDPLTYAVVTGPAHGSLSGAAPNLTYTPASSYSGPDGFTFKANDGTVDSNVATVSITVTAVNDVPVAADQLVITPEDTAVAITLTATDGDGDPLTYAVVTGPAHGSLSGAAPNLTYTPASSYSGPDGFTFKANDGTVDSNVATVSITVTAVNDVPVAADQSVTTPEETPVAITLTATDGDGDPLTYAVVTGPAHGSLSGTAPNLTYTPASSYSGPDGFTFKANDGTVDSNVATVSITVTPVNDVPVAADQSVTTLEETPVAITLTATDGDGDPLTYAVVTGPAHGSLSGTAPNLTYTPASSYSGPDGFTFKANDGTVDSNVATVSITVTAVNDVPVAADQSVTTLEETPVAITLTATDGDGDPLTYAVVTGPAHGSLSGTAPNLTYTPAASYSGPDGFTFKANDGTVDSNVATVSITVTPVNDVPVAADQSVTTLEETPVAITLTATDGDGDPLTYAVVTGPAHGSLSGTAPNLTYTPASSYSGPDGFTFTANDGTVDSNVATVSITVTPVNDVPVAADQSVTTLEETPVAITLTATDGDGDPLTYAVVTGPAHGSLSGTAPNLTYTPASSYNGPDGFTFKANDGTVDSNVATVSITVTAVNDVPVAAGQSVTTLEDTAVPITLTATDGDGDPLTYAVVTGPAHGSLSGTAPNLTYTPAASYSGPDGFTFKANDGTVDSNVATVSITVTPVNRAPFANAGPDHDVGAGPTCSASVTLDGRGSNDPDGDPLAFLWTAPGVTFDNPASATPAGVFPLGSTTASLVVSDGQLSSTPDIALVRVADTTPPTITAAWVVQPQGGHGLRGSSSLHGKKHGDRSEAFGGCNGEVTYRLEFGAIDNCDPAPQRTGVIVTPSLTGLTVHLRTASRIEIEFDPAHHRVDIAGPNPQALLTQLQQLGGFVVPIGQLVEWEPGASGGSVDYSFDQGGTLNIDGGVLPVLRVTARDAAGNSSTRDVSPTNVPPVCSSASASPRNLWPPNHKYKSIAIQGVSDPEGRPVTITVTGVRQDEPINGLGDGDSSPDAVLSPLKVRAERSGTGNGRVYHVSFTAADAAGGTCGGTVKVCVPHDQGGGAVCVDEGPLYNSVQP